MYDRSSLHSLVDCNATPKDKASNSPISARVYAHRHRLTCNVYHVHLQKGSDAKRAAGNDESHLSVSSGLGFGFSSLLLEHHHLSLHGSQPVMDCCLFCMQLLKALL